MPYYRGDSYGRGNNYYRGDPFLGGVVAGLVGGAVKKAARWVGQRVSGAGARAVTTIARDLAPTTVAGAAGYAMGRGAQPVLSPIQPLGPMAGPDITWQKRRRMNPLNPKALRRALRRAEGFEKFAAKTVNALYRVIDGRKVRTYKKKTRS